MTSRKQKVEQLLQEGEKLVKTTRKQANQAQAILNGNKAKGISRR